MTVLTTFTYFLCGALEMKLTGDTRKASWKNYGILSVYTYGGMAMTNYALSYLNYATRIVFKSAKIIPVMAFSVLIVGKKYNWKEWLSAAILVLGIVLFTLGDVASSPAFAPIGVALILVPPASTLSAPTSRRRTSSAARTPPPPRRCSASPLSSVPSTVSSPSSPPALGSPLSPTPCSTPRSFP